MSELKETLHVEVEGYQKQLNDFFAKHVVGITLESIEVEAHFGHDEIQVYFHDKTHRWSSEAVKVYLRWGRDWKTEEYYPLKGEFSYGSGGWEDGFSAQELLEVQIQALTGAKNAIELAHQNEDFLKETHRLFKKTQGQLYKIYDAERQVEEEIKLQELTESFIPVTKDFTPITAEAILEKLKEDNYYNEISVFATSYQHGRLNITPVKFSRTKNDRSIFERNQSRTSLRDIKYEVENSMFFINEFDMTHYEMQRFTRKGFETVEDYQTRLAEFTEEK